MSRLVATFVRGLGVVLPVALTIWLLVWAVRGIETLLREVFLWFFPPDAYLPGLGLVLAVMVIFATGVLVQVFVVRQLWGWFESLLERIPLVKTVYHAIRDFLAFFSTNLAVESATVVLVEVGGGAQVIGFVTDQQPSFAMVASSADTPGPLAVYFPMSYMVGGYTALVPRERIRPCNLSVEQAMRYALTAGIQARR